MIRYKELFQLFCNFWDLVAEFTELSNLLEFIFVHAYKFISLFYCVLKILNALFINFRNLLFPLMGLYNFFTLFSSSNILSSMSSILLIVIQLKFFRLLGDFISRLILVCAFFIIFSISISCIFLNSAGVYVLFYLI